MPTTTEPVAAGLLQATWTGQQLFLWSRAGDIDAALPELPGLTGSGRRAVRPIAFLRKRSTPGRSPWATVEGVDLEVADALPILASLTHDAPVSDAIRAYSLAAKLALELAARRRVVPTVRAGHARWIAVFSSPDDRGRLDRIAASLPLAARFPTGDTGKAPLAAPGATTRSFTDAVVDYVYRRDAYAGPARGWALDFAHALRGGETRFSVRDARAQATPERIAAWAARAEAPLPRVGFALDLPDRHDVPVDRARAADPPQFALRIVVHPPGDPRSTTTVDEAWSAGKILAVGGQELYHPAEAVLRGLARAARLYPPLAECVAGDRPRDLTLDAQQAWTFLETGRPALLAAGFAVLMPAEFEHAGRQRIRARIRLGLGADGAFTLADMLAYRWEILIGERVLDGSEFASLLSQSRPIVRWQDDWVFLDPAELSRLPRDLQAVGRMGASEALRAVLTGEHDGVPVVADERLAQLLDALREPPDRPYPGGFHAVLRPYQAKGFAWLCALGDLGLGALLADDMGLGKTVQLIAYLASRPPAAPGSHRASLVVCPTSVLGNWQRELARFAPRLRVLRWHGLGRSDSAIEEADVVLTTYGLLVRDAAVLCEYDWDVVTLDEAQSVKNPESRRARVARRLKARHRVALTGTPVENRLDELWSVMDFLVPGLLGGRAPFQREFAVPIERFGDVEAANRLRMTVAPFLLRRTKTDPNVASDLPDKLEQREYCVLTDEQRRLYLDVAETAMQEISAAANVERRGRVLAMLTALKQICNHPFHYLKRFDVDADATLRGRSGKLERITELVGEIADCNEKVVIFTQYREMGELLQSHLETVLGESIPFLHGAVSASGRDEMVRRFQADDDFAPTALLVSLKAGGTGLNLTSATHVVHYDRWWNPAIEDQATDRAHRIGQKQTVLVHKLVCEGTLEERIDTLLDEKRELFDAVVGSGERWVTELDDDALRALVLLSPNAPTGDDGEDG